MRLLSVAALIGVLCTVIATFESSRDRAPIPHQIEASLPAKDATFFGLPFALIRNAGQWDHRTLFAAWRDDVIVSLERDAIALQSELELVRLRFEGGADLARSRLVGEEELPGAYNFFIGNDPERWRTQVPSYSSVRYSGMYEGIDIRVREGSGTVEYDLLIQPGADLSQVVVRCEGVEGLRLATDGKLVMETKVGTVTQHQPIAWEVLPSGSTRPVRCSYRLVDDQRFRFVTSPRSLTLALVIDPGITWSTFLGGSSGDTVVDLEIHPSGDILVAGNTVSGNFPTTPGAYDETFNGIAGLALNAYVARLDSTGNALVYATFLGDSDGTTGATGIGVDEGGRIAIVGSTKSDNHPTTPGAFDATYNGGFNDAFVSLIDASGSELLMSTYLGGSATDAIGGVDFDSRGRLVIAGGTGSSEFPVTPGAHDTIFDGVSEAVVAWLDPSETGAEQLALSTFVGGSDADSASQLVLINGDTPVIAGATTSADFPVSAGALNTEIRLPQAHFVAVVSPDGSAVDHATFIKGRIRGLDADRSGVVTICGDLPAPGFQVTPAAYKTDPDEVFVCRLDPTLSTLVWSTYLGGDLGWENVFDVSVDPSGAVVVTGNTESPDFPTTPNAHDTTFTGGCADGYVAYLSADGGELLYGSYLGDSGIACIFPETVEADAVGTAVIGGWNTEGFFPTTRDSFDPTYNGGGDAFLLRMPLLPAWGNLGQGLAGTNGVTPRLHGIGALCEGETVALDMQSALPGSTATLVIGLAQIDADFKGGTLVPSADILIFGLPVDGAGKLTVSGAWPSGVPPGFESFFQIWVNDPGAPKGLSASNGAKATAP